MHNFRQSIRPRCRPHTKEQLQQHEINSARNIVIYIADFLINFIRFDIANGTFPPIYKIKDIPITYFTQRITRLSLFKMEYEVLDNWEFFLPLVEFPIRGIFNRTIDLIAERKHSVINDEYIKQFLVKMQTNPYLAHLPNLYFKHFPLGPPPPMNYPENV
jgi:hypothetical protein